jgi:hypothetical protein
MVLQFYFFLNHVLHKTGRTPGEHYGENPWQTPNINIKLERIFNIVGVILVRFQYE